MHVRSELKTNFDDLCLRLNQTLDLVLNGATVQRVDSCIDIALLYTPPWIDLWDKRFCIPKPQHSPNILYLVMDCEVLHVHDSTNTVVIEEDGFRVELLEICSE